MKLLLGLFVFLLVINIAAAWTGYTHDWICDKADLSNLDCHSADNSQVQKGYPGLSPTYHHCTNNSNICSARLSATKFKEMGTPETAGFAAHLYADALVPVHWYSTDYNSCHGVFEKKIEENIMNTYDFKLKIFNDFLDMSAWSLNMTCKTKDTNKIVTLYADNNYMNYVVMSVSVSMKSTPTNLASEVYDATWIVVGILVVLVILIILLVIFGRRNKK